MDCFWGFVSRQPPLANPCSKPLIARRTRLPYEDCSLPTQAHRESAHKTGVWGGKSFLTSYGLNIMYTIFTAALIMSMCEDPILIRHPNPRIPYNTTIPVCNQVSNGNSYQGEPGRGKNCSHCNFQVSLLRICPSPTQSQMENQTLGSGVETGCPILGAKN